MTPVQAGGVSIGGASPLVLIAGPCVIESEQHATELAGQLVEIARRAGVPLVFKASYDKANRTSIRSFRGPGLDEGLRVLAGIKSRYGVPILTDIHEPAQAIGSMNSACPAVTPSPAPGSCRLCVTS